VKAGEKRLGRKDKVERKKKKEERKGKKENCLVDNKISYISLLTLSSFSILIFHLFIPHIWCRLRMKHYEKRMSGTVA